MTWKNHCILNLYLIPIFNACYGFPVLEKYWPLPFISKSTASSGSRMLKTFILIAGSCRVRIILTVKLNTNPEIKMETDISKWPLPKQVSGLFNISKRLKRFINPKNEENIKQLPKLLWRRNWLKPAIMF